MNRHESPAGYSMVELMVTMVIFLSLLGAVATTMNVGEDSWPTVAADLEIREITRDARERITREFQNSGINQDGVSQMQVIAGNGADGTDVVKFAVPILCDENQGWIDDNGEIAHWGATLTWRCSCSEGDRSCITECMDPDGDCANIEYSHIQYVKNPLDQLIRQVINFNGDVLRSDLIAENVTDFQVEPTDRCLYTFRMTVRKSTPRKRDMELTSVWQVHARNNHDPNNWGCSL
jgi:prepilin-type N-terminal cleavage/methylation domain-containing protein